MGERSTSQSLDLRLYHLQNHQKHILNIRVPWVSDPDLKVHRAAMAKVLNPRHLTQRYS